MALVRKGLEPYFDFEKFARREERAKEASPFYGRERLLFFHLENGETALVRAYRHGGMLRHLTGELFFTWPPRPFKELFLTEEARRRGVPTLEIFAAWVERSWGPFYRGWLFTRELKDAKDLWSALQGKSDGGWDRNLLLKAVAQAIRQMHRQGIYHRDLNLKNILVKQEGGGTRSYVIDFDKARLFPGEVPSGMARKNLNRLLRSACKLDPEGRFLSLEDRNLLIRFYREAV